MKKTREWKLFSSVARDLDSYHSLADIPFEDLPPELKVAIEGNGGNLDLPHERLEDGSFIVQLPEDH
jgi:hypothetical protein